MVNVSLKMDITHYCVKYYNYQNALPTFFCQIYRGYYTVARRYELYF